MATIRYKCDACLREVELLENKTGLTTLSNCIITENCRGSLFKIRRNNRSRVSFGEEDIDLNNNLMNRKERKVFFPFSKDIPSKRWVVRHNLGSFPAISVFIETDDGINIREANKSEYTRRDIDKNTLEVVFNANQTGKVHAISRSISDQDIPQSTLVENTINISPNGTLSIAVLSKAFGESSIDPQNPIDVRFDVSLKEPNEEEIFCVEEFKNGLRSPWSDYQAMSFRKRRNYIVKTVNLLDLKVIQERYNSLTEIPELTEFKFNSISYNGSVFKPIRSKNALILLSSPPYTKSDKIMDKIIDLGERNEETSGRKYIFSNGKLFAVEDDIERVYPPIEKDDILFKVDDSFGIAPTPTPTPSVSESATPTPTPTPTPSVSESATPTPTPSVSESATPTPTPTPTPSVSESATPTPTPTPSVSSNLWSPADTTTSLWLEGSNSSSFILDGSLIDLWKDLSTNNRDASPPSGRPAYDAQNGAVVYDASEQLLAPQFNFSEGVVAIVAEQTNPSSTQQNTIIRDDSSGNWRHLLRWVNPSSASDFNAFIQTDLAEGIATVTLPNDRILLIVRWMASDELHIVRESGNIIYNETLIGNNLLPANDISIGSHPTGINGLRGNLHELIYFPMDSDIEKVEGYLAHKWQLTNRLPTSHPYKNSPP